MTYALRCPLCLGASIRYAFGRWRCWKCKDNFAADAVIRDGDRKPLITRTLIRQRERNGSYPRAGRASSCTQS